MDKPLWMWVFFFGVIGALLLFDLGVLHRKQRNIGIREALLLSLFYFLLALGFDGFIFHALGSQAGYEFFMGYLVEKSLSLDNLFVFLLIFTHFGVPREYQHRVLFWGILGALLLRGLIISAGTVLIQEFEWVTYIFGAFLIFTGIKLLIEVEEEPDLSQNRIIGFLRGKFRVTENYEGQRFFTRRNAVLWVTPLFLVLILIEISDIVFAVDSIPAVFAITRDPFIIFTSNIFAILGLRALFFALAAVLYRFEHVKYGLSVILVMIGGKMLLNQYVGYDLFSTEISLAATVAILAFSVLISLSKTRRAPSEIVRRGWVPGSPAKPTDKNTTE